MLRIPDEIERQLFSEARTFGAWLPQEVPDQILRDIYERMKWGPTSANTCPARIIFVRSGPEKQRLLGCVAEMNLEKVKAAPVTAILAQDEKFYDKIPQLLPPAAHYREFFASNPALAETTMFRNSSLQGGYFILAARSVGLDCGPMSGFDNARVDQEFLGGTGWKSNFICNLGYGDPTQLHPRQPRLSFDEACKLV